MLHIMVATMAMFAITMPHLTAIEAALRRQVATTHDWESRAAQRQSRVEELEGLAERLGAACRAEEEQARSQAASVRAAVSSAAEAAMQRHWREQDAFVEGLFAQLAATRRTEARQRTPPPAGTMATSAQRGCGAVMRGLAPAAVASLDQEAAGPYADGRPASDPSAAARRRQAGTRRGSYPWTQAGAGGTAATPGLAAGWQAEEPCSPGSDGDWERIDDSRSVGEGGRALEDVWCRDHRPGPWGTRERGLPRLGRAEAVLAAVAGDLRGAADMFTGTAAPATTASGKWAERQTHAPVSATGAVHSSRHREGQGPRGTPMPPQPCPRPSGAPEEGPWSPAPTRTAQLARPQGALQLGSKATLAHEEVVELERPGHVQDPRSGRSQRVRAGQPESAGGERAAKSETENQQAGAPQALSPSTVSPPTSPGSWLGADGLAWEEEMANQSQALLQRTQVLLEDFRGGAIAQGCGCNRMHFLGFLLSSNAIAPPHARITLTTNPEAAATRETFPFFDHRGNPPQSSIIWNLSRQADGCISVGGGSSPQVNSVLRAQEHASRRGASREAAERGGEAT